MRSPLFFVFLLFRFCASGQTYNADSIETIFDTLPDSTRIREANALSRYYLDVNFEKSIHFARVAYSLADKVNNEQDKAHTYINWAIAQYNFGRYDSSLFYNFRALKIYQALADTSKMATAYNNISGAYNALGDHSSAVYYAYKAYNIHLEKKNWWKVAISCLNLSSSFYEARDYDATLSWARKAYKFYTQAGKPEDLAYALQMYVDVYIAQKQIDSALHYLNEISGLNDHYPNEYLVSVNQAQRGEVYALQGKYDSAIAMYKACIKFYEDANLGDAVLHTRLNLSRAYMALHRMDDALTHAIDSYERSKSINNKTMIVKSSALVAEVFSEKKQFMNALEYSQIANAYKDSIMAQSLKGSLEGRFFDVQLEDETREKHAVLSALERQDAIIGKQWAVIVIFTIGMVALTVVSYYVRRAAQYRKKINDQLIASNTKLSQMNDEINALVNTIVHDLKSPLNSVQGILSLVDTSAGNTETKSLIAMANKSLDNGHAIIRQLLELRELEEDRAEINYSQIDTKEFLDEICESFSHTAQQKKIVLSVTANVDSFTSDKVIVRRMIDNLVSNALKFSPPDTEVSVTAFRENGNVHFRVRDQGPGFSDEDLGKLYGKFQKLSARPTGGENSTGLGLATVQALTRHLNASIELDTAPGKGSVFTLRVPDGRNAHTNR